MHEYVRIRTPQKLTRQTPETHATTLRFHNVVACVSGVWRVSFWGLARRAFSQCRRVRFRGLARELPGFSATPRTSTHNCVYRRISVHICAYLHILTHICVYRPISAHINAYRCIPAHIGRIPKRARHPWPGGMRGCVSISIPESRDEPGHQTKTNRKELNK